ncbi:MAG TPA: mycothiol synthase [Trebonia sp.]|nr:mycothiol synthase [Trebonia sp.]
MTRHSPPVAEGPLSPAQAALVAELAEAVGQADAVAPLSEHALLHARRPDGTARDLIIVSNGRALGYAHLDLAADPETADLSGELVVHPGNRRQGHGGALLAALTGPLATQGPPATPVGHGIRLWAHGDLPAAAGFAAAGGFSRARSLWQMRRALDGADAALPVPEFPAGVTVRAFVPGRDEEAWLAANARAFAHHPEQGGWTKADLEVREAEPWFDPEGFFLAERDGVLVGFHWTKVHPEGPDGSPEGEVYVVGVDPAGQGGGLGRALTIAGMRYLQGQGLAHVMLYVDADNAPAARMYTALGFSRWNTDVMYRRG